MPDLPKVTLENPGVVYFNTSHIYKKLLFPAATAATRRLAVLLFPERSRMPEPHFQTEPEQPPGQQQTRAEEQTW